MRNKKIILLILFFLSTLVGITSNISLVTGYVGTYEKRTDSSNPFIFTKDILYWNDHVDVSGVEYLYHQVFLQEGKHYLFFFDSGFATDAILWIHYSADDSIDPFSVYVPDYPIKYVLLFSPSQTGYYTIILRFGLEGFYTSSSIQIGVLEVPIINLNEEIDWNYWDFTRDAITAAKMDLVGDWYEMGSIEEGTGYDVSYSDSIFYHDLEPPLSVSGYIQLTESNSDYQLDSDTEKFFSSGEYLFFSLSGAPFGIRKVPEQSTGGSIPGYSLLLVGIISLVSIFIISKRIYK